MYSKSVPRVLQVLDVVYHTSDLFVYFETLDFSHEEELGSVPKQDCLSQRCSL